MSDEDSIIKAGDLPTEDDRLLANVLRRLMADGLLEEVGYEGLGYTDLSGQRFQVDAAARVTPEEAEVIAREEKRIREQSEAEYEASKNAEGAT